MKKYRLIVFCLYAASMAFIIVGSYFNNLPKRHNQNSDSKYLQSIGVPDKVTVLPKASIEPIYPKVIEPTKEIPVARPTNTTKVGRNTPGRTNVTSARYRILVRTRYSALYKSLGLTNAEIDKFETAAAGQYQAIDLFSTDLSMYPQEREQEILRQQLSYLERVVSDTLGPERVNAFRDFVSTSDLRLIVDSLAAHTAYTETPLSAEQANSTLASLVENLRTKGHIRANPADVDWIGVMKEVKGTLSPQQQTALQAIVDVIEFDNTFRKVTKLPYRVPVHGF